MTYSGQPPFIKITRNIRSLLCLDLGAAMTNLFLINDYSATFLQNSVQDWS